jgi:hypothetical protein
LPAAVIVPSSWIFPEDCREYEWEDDILTTASHDNTDVNYCKQREYENMEQANVQRAREWRWRSDDWRRRTKNDFWH